MAKIYFISEAAVKKSVLDQNLSPDYIAPLIIVSQDTTVFEALGKALFDRVKTEIESGTVSNEIKVLLEDHLHEIIKWDVCDKIQVPINNKIRNTGVVSSQDANTIPTALEDIKYTKHQYANYVSSYTVKMVKYIKDNLNLYPEFYDGECNGRQTNYNCPIYLG